MKIITKLPVLLLLAFMALTSCEYAALEDVNPTTATVDENTALSNARLATRADFKGRIRRIRIKERNNGSNYRVVAHVENNVEDVVNQVVETSLEVLTDVDATLEFRTTGKDTEPTQTVILKLIGKTEDGKYLKYANTDVKFEKNPAGRIIKVKAALMTEKGELLEEPISTFVTAEGKNTILNRTPKLKMNRKGDSFKISTRTSRRRIKKQMLSTLQTYTGKTIDDISDDEVREYMASLKIQARIIPNNGGSETEEHTILIGFLEIERGFTLRNTGVTFVETDNVVDMEYTVAFRISDSGGEELDYAEFRITGQE